MAEKSTFWSEFKTFIARGNVMDMAVGVVIGGAFTAIVNSLVGDIINPLIGKLFGGVDLSEAKVVLTEATEETAEVGKPGVAPAQLRQVPLEHVAGGHPPGADAAADIGDKGRQQK
ncbi:MAG: large conductance mechanosensitive channel protein MscL, partial [Clostridia bacterium]|nr:large conductance mechanosensitive channel protein MscL [Clostridia bacterium]